MAAPGDLGDRRRRRFGLGAVAPVAALGAEVRPRPQRAVGRPPVVHRAQGARRRAALGPHFLLGHATRRTGPFGLAIGKWFWSESFYRATMARTDQTVLMAYDTSIGVKKNYIGFVAHETGLLLDWACASPPHRVLIGIPSYEDAPRLSNP